MGFTIMHGRGHGPYRAVGLLRACTAQTEILRISCGSLQASLEVRVALHPLMLQDVCYETE